MEAPKMDQHERLDPTEIRRKILDYMDEALDILAADPVNNVAAAREKADQAMELSNALSRQNAKEGVRSKDEDTWPPKKTGYSNAWDIIKNTWHSSSASKDVEGQREKIVHDIAEAKAMIQEERAALNK